MATVQTLNPFAIWTQILVKVYEQVIVSKFLIYLEHILEKC